MATAIDWVTGIISVPKADMVLIQSNPVEIRELQTNAWRLELRDLEDDVSGRPWPRTHNHNADVLVGGISLADVFLILDPYTITFEDGQYAVYLQGTNNNILEKTNKNQVSVNPSNSAGLVNSLAIEFGEFGGGVTVDAGNITGKAKSGSIYPTGTGRQPSSNVPDAMVIAAAKGFKRIYVIGDLILDTGDDVSDKTIIGVNPVQTTVTLNDGADVTNSEITHCTITGIFDGGNVIRKCEIGTLSYVNGEIEFSTLLETITLGGAKEAHIHNCRSGVSGSGTPIIDCGGSGQGLQIRDYHGGIQLTNKTGADKISIDMSSGQIKFTSSVTNGEIVCRGVGAITEDLSVGATIIDQMLNPDRIWRYVRA